MKFNVQERNTNKYCCQYKIKQGYLGRLILASAKYNLLALKNLQSNLVIFTKI